jgi:hypothetical protein
LTSLSGQLFARHAPEFGAQPGSQQAGDGYIAPGFAATVHRIHALASDVHFMDYPEMCIDDPIGQSLDLIAHVGDPS